ncbi:MAG: MurR/RpiR family transcriptional regulator [Amphritea sp.]
MSIAIEDRIREVYEELPRSERLIADLIMDFPGDLATHSVTELVTRVGTSKAAATRLFRRLGYDDFSQIRKESRAARNEGAPIYLHTVDQQDSTLEDELKAHCDTEVSNLLRCFESLDSDVIKEVVNLITTASNVWIIGYGNSYMPAMYSGQQLIQLRQNVHVLPKTAQALEKDLVGLTDSDILIAIGFRRRPPILYQTMDYTKSVGAKILYITDQSEDKTRKIADWTIRCPVTSTSLFDSYSTAFSIMNYLCSAVAKEFGNDSIMRLRRAERLHELLYDL